MAYTSHSNGPFGASHPQMRRGPLSLILLSLSFHFPVQAVNWNGVRSGFALQVCDELLFSSDENPPDLSVEELMERLMRAELLTTVAGIKPMSWSLSMGVEMRLLPAGASGETYRRLSAAVSSGALNSPKFQWLFFSTGLPEESKNLRLPDVYILNLEAISALLLRQNVRETLSTLRVWKLNSFSRDEVIEKFKLAAKFWSTRGLNVREIVDSSHDFHVLAGILLGFEPEDVRRFAAPRTHGESRHTTTYIYFMHHGFDLGSYETFRAQLTPRQRADQVRAALAVAKYEAAKVRGLSALEIFRNWDKL